MMKGRDDQGEKEKGRKANGIAGYLEALNAKRSLWNAGLSLALTWRDLSSALKKFSKAMGGGLHFRTGSIIGGQDVRI